MAFCLNRWINHSSHRKRAPWPCSSASPAQPLPWAGTRPGLCSRNPGNPALPAHSARVPRDPGSAFWPLQGAPGSPQCTLHQGAQSKAGLNRAGFWASLQVRRSLCALFAWAVALWQGPRLFLALGCCHGEQCWLLSAPLCWGLSWG